MIKSRNRQTASTTRGGNKKIKGAKPKEYEGVQYLSGLEAYCARRFKEAGITAYYEPFSVQVRPKFTSSCSSMEFGESKKKGMPVEKYFKVVSPNIMAISYKPDFCSAQTLEECTWICEPKGMNTPVFQMRWKLFKAALEEKGLTPKLYLPNNQKHVEAVIADILASQQLVL